MNNKVQAIDIASLISKLADKFELMIKDNRQGFSLVAKCLNNINEDVGIDMNIIYNSLLMLCYELIKTDGEENQEE